MSFRRKVVRSGIQILPLAYMAFIWFLSSRPSHSVVDLGFYDSLIKESLHLVEFAILYGLLVLALLTRGELTPAGNKLAVIISVAYALLDEFHQSFIPSRSASVTDIIKDVTGIAFVWYVVRETYFRNPYAKITRFLFWVTRTFAPPGKQQEKKEER
ncbi:VanZ family protein [Desulforamulus putei]|uniref:VanZ like family protein n=1 Tax=Desulforamulus putei DSM 12395 TaxID=1121429 RepID=A0A1M5A5W1_9FIRM|nr:VanZ family protein [Desulforamulus putei]SHF25683.1 VanZ like family protein [Desulforamulus putei DSM 12395]